MTTLALVVSILFIIVCIMFAILLGMGIYVLAQILKERRDVHEDL